jgi:tetratricopeptide (TPR) repeat protein
MEFLVLIAFFGYIYYLRNFADLRTKSEKEFANLAPGIQLYKSDKIDEAFTYFNQKIKSQPKSSVAYLYRGLCYLAKNQKEEALIDFKTGLSYDESVAELHLELGKFYFHSGNQELALASLNKAVFNSNGTNASAFHWRAKVKEALGQLEEAQTDFDQEATLLQLTTNGTTSPVATQPFLNRRLLINSFLVVFTSAVLLYFVKTSEGIHVPYLVAVFWAIAIGFAEPQKGWLLALLQSLFLIIGYQLVGNSPESTSKQELEYFSLFGSILLTFTGSFLGAFMKRALATS